MKTWPFKLVSNYFRISQKMSDLYLQCHVVSHLHNRGRLTHESTAPLGATGLCQLLKNMAEFEGAILFVQKSTSIDSVQFNFVHHNSLCCASSLIKGSEPEPPSGGCATSRLRVFNDSIMACRQPAQDSISIICDETIVFRIAVLCE